MLERPIAAGEQFLLCTDGVHRVVDYAAIAAVLQREVSIEAAVDRLRATLDGGGPDNASLIVVHPTA